MIKRIKRKSDAELLFSFPEPMISQEDHPKIIMRALKKGIYFDGFPVMRNNVERPVATPLCRLDLMAEKALFLQGVVRVQLRRFSGGMALDTGFLCRQYAVNGVGGNVRRLFPGGGKNIKDKD